MILQGPLGGGGRERMEGKGRSARSSSSLLPSSLLLAPLDSPPNSMEIYDDELVGRCISKESVEFYVKKKAEEDARKENSQ